MPSVQCACLVRCIVGVNEEFEALFDRWDDFFPGLADDIDNVATEVSETITIPALSWHVRMVGCCS
jgi:hypothetical protein